MKHAISSNIISFRLIEPVFKAVKTIITLSMCALLSFYLPRKVFLVQYFKTRLGTVFGVAKRLNKSFPYIKPTFLKSKFDSTRKALNLLDMVTLSSSANEVPRVDALKTISVVSKDIRHVQTTLEVSNHIMIVRVIPMLEDSKASLPFVSSGAMNLLTMIAAILPPRGLAKATLSAIDNIVYYDLWAASLVTHPGLRGLSFLSQDARHVLKAKGEYPVQKVLQELCLHSRTKDLNSSGKMCREPVSQAGSNLDPLPGC